MTPRRALLVGLLPFASLLACSHGGGASGKVSVPAGKLERIERARSPYESIVSGGDEGSGKELPKNDPILMTGKSGGTPGLVLTRAMEGAQALGYTLLMVDDRTLFFVAQRQTSILASMLGSQSGGCKIAVGTDKDLETGATQVTLKGIAFTATSRALCEKDLNKVLAYARGEAMVKPRKPSPLQKRSVYDQEER
ncbi:MAG: hypothetical protein A2Y95_12735 [Deltaproteobacteria bacterium RBG_13_65_10]|nr:MAG: hypothetical protein A2Y95_12735 [Deltaproteobacteria bacterium RBG_13_65_10]